MINPEYMDAQFTLIREVMERAAVVGGRSQEEFLDDPVLADAGIRQLTVLFEACHNVAKHLIARHAWREAEHKADAFDVLVEDSVISSEVAAALIQAGRFRNLAVYKASAVDNRTVHEILRTRLDDFRQFTTQSARWMRDHAESQTADPNT